MTSREIEGDTQTSISDAILRYRWLVLVLAVTGAVLATLASRLRPPVVEATTSVIVSDPTTQSILVPGDAGTSDRFVANQLEILRSPLLADRVADLSSQAGMPVTGDDILDNASFANLADTDVITISYFAETDREAQEVVENIVTAFEEIRADQQRDETEAILDRLESAEATIVGDLASTQSQITDFRAVRDLQSQIDLVINELGSISAQLLGELTAVQRDALEERQVQRGLQLETLRSALLAETSSPLLQGLVRQEAELTSRLAEVTARISEVEIESQTVRSVVAFAGAPRVIDSGAASSRLLVALAGFVLGALLGAGVAYWRTTTRTSYQDRLEPERVLGIPVVADIPRFGDAGITSALAVRDEPRSAVAEAFRFAASGLQVLMDRHGHRSVMIVSSRVGDGKSTVAANCALAIARGGRNVLVVDADFGNQEVTRLLIGDVRRAPGLPELLAGDVSLDNAVSRVAVAQGVSLQLIGRGLVPVVAPELFASRDLKVALSETFSQYDVVVIDGPPMMQVAYGGLLAGLADCAILVIDHSSGTDSSKELGQRLELVGANPIGYIYNRAPLRAEMMSSEGSMKDVLGDSGFAAAVGRRRGSNGE
jgi:Mrp family chromosome partitioning ATPase/uncharacterized protein involved in exopolysaccharide biosynthesis